jgi:hypothetical protein
MPSPLDPSQIKAVSARLLHFLAISAPFRAISIHVLAKHFYALSFHAQAFLIPAMSDQGFALPLRDNSIPRFALPPQISPGLRFSASIRGG